MLQLAIAGKKLQIKLQSKLVSYPDPAPRTLAEREERFFAASPADPFSYEEDYDDLFDDPWKDKRSERELARIMERGAAYPHQLNRARGLLIERRNSKNKEKYDWDLDRNDSLNSGYLDGYEYRSNYGTRYDSLYKRFCNSSEVLSIHEASELGFSPILDITLIIEAVHENIAPKESIRAILLMGSASKMHQKVTVGRNIFGLRYQSLSKVVTEPTIHDIDIMVLLDPKTKKKVGEIEANGPVHKQESCGYGVYNDTRSVIGMYDIFGLTTEEYEDGLHRGDFMMEHIKKHGILLVGDFPYPKSDSAIKWKRNGVGKWKPKRILKKSSLTNRRKV